MRKRYLALAAVAMAGTTTTAFADGSATITDATGVYQSPGSGGAFTVTEGPVTGNGTYNGLYGGNRISGDGRSSSNSFLSFCLETTEYLNFGSTYYTQISTSADNGGAGGGDPDPLSNVTAKLYHEFRRLPSNSGSASVTWGTATDFFGGEFGTDITTADSEAIQNAIWYSEGELTSISGDALDVYNWAVANQSGLLRVRVLRQWGSWTASGGYSDPKQDLLTLIPLPPSAYAGMGTLAALLGFGYIRRRNLAAV